MRTTVWLTCLLLMATVASFTPTASAVGICSSLTDARCPHLLCYGYSWSYPDPYYHCQTWIDPPYPPPCYICDPQGLPLLP